LLLLTLSLSFKNEFIILKLGEKQTETYFK